MRVIYEMLKCSLRYLCLCVRVCVSFKELQHSDQKIQVKFQTFLLYISTQRIPHADIIIISQGTVYSINNIFYTHSFISLYQLRLCDTCQLLKWTAFSVIIILFTSNKRTRNWCLVCVSAFKQYVKWQTDVSLRLFPLDASALTIYAHNSIDSLRICASVRTGKRERIVSDFDFEMTITFAVSVCLPEKTESGSRILLSDSHQTNK